MITTVTSAISFAANSFWRSTTASTLHTVFTSYAFNQSLPPLGRAIRHNITHGITGIFSGAAGFVLKPFVATVIPSSDSSESFFQKYVPSFFREDKSGAAFTAEVVTTAAMVTAGAAIVGPVTVTGLAAKIGVSLLTDFAWNKVTELAWNVLYGSKKDDKKP